MEIFVNGLQKSIESEMSLTELLASLGTPARGVAVAVNARIVHAENRPATTVRSGDEIEIVTANPGG